MAVSIFKISCNARTRETSARLPMSPSFLSGADQGENSAERRSAELPGGQRGALVGGTLTISVTPRVAGGCRRGTPVVSCARYHMQRSLTGSFWHPEEKKTLAHTSVKCRSQSKHVLYNVCNVSHAGRALLKRSQPPTYLFTEAADQAIRRASSRNHIAALRHLMAGWSLRCIKKSQSSPPERGQTDATL